MKKTLKIKFVDFNEGATAVKVLTQHLEKRYTIELSDEPEWLFFSVFGNEHLAYNNCVKIFFTGENQAPDFNLCDYALGFEHLTFGDRYLRFPLWLLYKADTDLLQHKHEHVSLKDKDGFCSFVYSNVNASKERGEFLEALEQYKPVHSGGRYRNNVGGPVADKLAFQRRHKFAVAFENACHDGYTTEKIAQAFAAQTVPIYWGDPRIAETFNPDSFINCRQFANWDEVVARVKAIDEDDALWTKMVQTPALIDPQAVQNAIQELDAFLFHIFDQSSLEARRFSRDYWALKQLRTRQREKRAYDRSFFGCARRFFNKHLYARLHKNERTWNCTQRLMRWLKI